MKKTILSTLMLIICSCAAVSEIQRNLSPKEKRENPPQTEKVIEEAPAKKPEPKYSIVPADESKRVVQTKHIEMRVNPTVTDDYIGVEIKNKTSEPVTILWGDSSIISGDSPSKILILGEERNRGVNFNKVIPPKATERNGITRAPIETSHLSFDIGPLCNTRDLASCVGHYRIFIMYEFDGKKYHTEFSFEFKPNEPAK